jgi:hypothetical protein
MAKHYVVLSSQVTPAMRSYSDHEVSLTYLQVPDANESLMDVAINPVNDDNWVKTGTVVWEDNSVTGILLPKEAMKK